MQALALQFNLSETTFVFPSDRATARRAHLHPELRDALRGPPHPRHGARGARGEGCRRLHSRSRCGRGSSRWSQRRRVDAAGERAEVARARRIEGRSRRDAGAHRRRSRVGPAAVGRHGLGTARDPARERRRRAPHDPALRPAARARQQRPAGDGLRMGANPDATRPGGADAVLARFFFRSRA
jgi:hypothetical protein